MKERARKKTSKQIICIIITIMLCNFIMPNYTYAIETNGGGTLVIDIARFACFIPDVVIEFLQKNFVVNKNIYDGIGIRKYEIFYGPGTIFAGKVPAFDINFIKPNKYYKEIDPYKIFSKGYSLEIAIEGATPGLLTDFGYIETESEVENEIESFIKEARTFFNAENTETGNVTKIGTIKGISYCFDMIRSGGARGGAVRFYKESDKDHAKNLMGFDEKVLGFKYDGTIIDETMQAKIDTLKSEMLQHFNVEKNEYNENVEKLKEVTTETVNEYVEEWEAREGTDFYNSGGATDEKIYVKYKTADNKEVEFGVWYCSYLGDEYIWRIIMENEQMAVVESDYKTSSAMLQTVVATWYNALRRVALVGLLSILVYIGIRIVLTSTSAKEKAKYKAMLKDWLIALCLLFALHYVMNITITVVEKINEIISSSVVGQKGEDVLISTIRTDIHDANNWSEVLVQTVLYCVLGVYTVIYTIQYLRRVIYLAFLTMIAPLITLTYPLDKIKDKKSQAFDMWLKDYIFFTLIQVVHLLLYYVLVGYSMDLAKEGNWIFAIVAIGFLTKAEKIMKKMFGFEKSKSMGAMAAGATGALVVNAINQLKGFGGKKGSSGGGSSGSGESSGGNVRTATKNPLAGINGAGGSVSPTGGGGTSGSSGGSSPRTTGSTPTPASAGGSTKPKRRLKGAAHVGGKFIGKNYQKIGGTALGVLTGGAGAMIGFAAGVAQGDLGAAFTGAMAGGAAGMNLGKGAVNLPGNIKNKVKTGWSNVKNTYREGAYGEEAAAAIKFDEEFRNGSTYKALTSNSNFSEESVQAMLDAGITDKKAMTAILDSRMNVEDAIKYQSIASNCPDTIYYNDNMLRTFWKRVMGEEEKDVEKIRDILGQFK